MDDSRPKTPPAESASTNASRDGGFVGRWSRLKAESRERSLEKPEAAPAPADPQTPPPDLPQPEQLTFESDYQQFFHPKVGEGVRRAALKKLFSDPRFNVMDGLDVYIDDYSKIEPIPAEMLAGLKQARNIFQWAKEDAEEREKDRTGARDAQHPPGASPATLEPPEGGRDSSDAREVQASEPAPARPSEDKQPTRS